MTTMITPVIQHAAPDLEIKSASRQNLHDSSFAKHFDRQLEEKNIQGKDKLGVRDAQNDSDANKVAHKKNTHSKGSSRQDLQEDESGIVTVASMMSSFMQDLQKTADQKDIAPGEWVAVLPDSSILHKLAADAGMEEAEMSLLQQQIIANGEELKLSDFFGVLNQHFNSMMDIPEITVPETELPMLEALLAKMGLSPEDVNNLSKQAVKNDGKLDLSLFLEGLRQLEAEGGLRNIQLSDLETEQLQNLLAQAGVSQSSITKLFPERYLERMFSGQASDFELSFERLQDILGKGIADISENRPQLNLSEFLKELDHVLSNTKFSDEGVGWTPVIQQSLTAVFREMQDAVDLARKRFTEEMFLEHKGIEEELQTMQQAMVEGKTGTLADHFSSNTPSAGYLSQFIQSVSPDDSGEIVSFAAMSEALLETQSSSQTQSSHIVSRNSQQLHSQVFQQISAAVMHGIKSDEHHLVLRLYPQELGEVKVDMLVKNEQLSITFNMENGRVKEMLESNMEQFRENMEQRGFSLGECSVSVGQREDFDSEWRRFMMSGDSMELHRATLEDLPDDVLYLRGDHLQLEGRGDSLSLFV